MFKKKGYAPDSFKSSDKLAVSYILLDKFLQITRAESNGNTFAFQYLIDGLSDFLTPYKDSIYMDKLKLINDLYNSAIERARGQIYRNPTIIAEYDYNKARGIYRELVTLCSRKGIYPEEVEIETVVHEELNLNVPKENLVQR